MLERMVVGSVPKKHHIAHRNADGALYHEECFTRDGFDGPYTILYHQHRPHTHAVASTKLGFPLPVDDRELASRPLAKRHYRSPDITVSGGPAITSRRPILFNDDVVVGISRPAGEDPAYFVNVDADELHYWHEGKGTLRTQLGDVAYTEGDYVFVPRGVMHRWIPDSGTPQYSFTLELSGGLHIPRQWRNEVGQLRMDAPYCHRDFQKPIFRGPIDERIREIVVKRGNAFHGFTLEHSPLDVVGWDGTVYPWVFPILAFQPRVGLTHLPPTWHGTFAAKGALVCSFVPRPVDFHPEAIPCPYPHSSVDVDEVIFYCRGNFTSRRGVAPGSVSHHPPGIPHGPHPGAYEASIGSTRTDELAVMLDCAKPLRPTRFASEVEDTSYQTSFL